VFYVLDEPLFLDLTTDDKRPPVTIDDDDDTQLFHEPPANVNPLYKLFKYQFQDGRVGWVTVKRCARFASVAAKISPSVGVNPECMRLLYDGQRQPLERQINDVSCIYNYIIFSNV
jgi:hypothetical protein